VPIHHLSRSSIARRLFPAALLLVVACGGAREGAEGGDTGARTAAAPVVAPDSFEVTFSTSRGDVVVRAYRAWAPRGADRLYALVRNGFYDDTRFFRVLDGFMAQFGASGDPEVARAWSDSAIPDDPVVQSNSRGMVTFASAGPDTRTTQLFINTADNARLDAMGFAPVGRVVSGMEAVDSLYSEYGEGAPNGAGPDQGRIASEGNAYLDREFPQLDAIRSARITEEWTGGS
jgi:peptidyl-prolyl cis-trans isomerase A (cyclophilin A)